MQRFFFFFKSSIYDSCVAKVEKDRGKLSEGQGWGWIGWSVWHHSWDHPKGRTLPLSRGTCSTDEHRAPKLRLLLQTLPWGVGGWVSASGPEPLGLSHWAEKGRNKEEKAAKQPPQCAGAATRGQLCARRRNGLIARRGSPPGRLSKPVSSPTRTTDTVTSQAI